MKNILLLGDSIRYGAPGSPGYGKIVKEKLDGKANVFAPEDNCRFVQYTLRYLYNWVRDLEDVKEKNRRYTLEQRTLGRFAFERRRAADTDRYVRLFSQKSL